MSEVRKSPVVPLIVAAVALIALVAGLVGARGGGDDDGTAGAGAGSTSSAPSAESSRPGESRPPAGAGRGTDSGRAPDETWAALVRREEGDPMALGEVDAPVVMIAYSEFQCPYCGSFARDTGPALIEEYVEDGTLRIEWRDFPYLGPESTTAAQAGRAAAAQDSFWAFHDEMYADQLPVNSGRLDEDHVAEIAAGLGLDVEQFRADMASAATEEAIARDFAEGQGIGVTGTPAFVINGVPVIGAQPLEVFEEAIEQASAEAGA